MTVAQLPPEPVLGETKPQGNMDTDTDTRVTASPGETEKTTEWRDDPHNPWNWPTGKKMLQLAMLSLNALLA